MAATRNRKTVTKTDKEATEKKPPRKRGRPRKPPEKEQKAPVVDTDLDELDDDEDGDYEAVANAISEVKSAAKVDDFPSREELLSGVDDESRMQNDTADSVMRRRSQGERHVHWKGNYNLKYNRVAEGCVSQFGGESEVEITRIMPKHAHIGIYPLNQMPTWRQVTELIMGNHWDGNAQKYKIQIMSTGRSIAAVCYFMTEENIQRRREYERMMGNWNGPQQQPQQPQQQQQPNQAGWPQQQQPQQQQPEQQQQYPQSGGQNWPQQQQQPEQQQQAPEGPPGWPQPPQGGMGAMPPWMQQQTPGGPPGWPQPPQGGMGAMPPWMQQQTPGGLPGWPQPPQWAQQLGAWPQPPQPPQAQSQPQQDDDDDDDDDDDLDLDDDVEDDNELSFSLPSPHMHGRHHPAPIAPPRPDPKVRQMERTVRTLQKELRRMERKNQRDMSQSSNYQAYVQQLQLWQMLQGFGQQVEGMKAQLVEEKRKVQEEQQQQQQAPPHNNMTMEQIVQLVQQSMQETLAQHRQQSDPTPEPQAQQAQPNPTQFTPQQMQAMQAMGYPPPGMAAVQQPATQASPEDELEATLRKFSRMQEMMQKFTPKQPEPPAWMQMMQPQVPAANPAKPEDAKADDGSPLKVFDMGPFRYVTDQTGKAVDFFTMMALNADNVKSWVQPALTAVREVREQVKDARKQQDTSEVVQMLEMMNHRMLQNQQIQDQQIADLSRRLAPSQETLAAMQQGRFETTQSPPVQKTPQNPPSQHGPRPTSAVPSKMSSPKGLLDGLANAKRTLQQTSQPGGDQSQGQ